MDLTADSFRALARSSPWRWRTLHFSHRSARGEVEAWVRRPGRLLVVTPDGQEHRVSGLPYSKAVLMAGPEEGARVPAPTMLPHEVTPPLRPDGLVAERPSDMSVDYDDPMFGNFTWVAMLDPVELSHHVDVADPRVDELAGRPVWRAVLRAEEGYDARCGGNCCELLWSDVSRRSESDDPEQWWPAPAEGTYPDCYDVALDLQTGVVVHLAPVGGARDDLAFDLTIHEVDADLDRFFPQ